MMEVKKIFIFLITGFEEIEAVATADILRRGGLDVCTISLTDSPVVVGGHGVPVTADAMFGDEDYSVARMLVLPGGTVKINEHDGLKTLILEHADAGGKVAAICAAPMVLGGLGLLRGKCATSYPGFEKYLTGATFVPDPVVVDGDIITGRGPGFTPDFALEIIRQLEGAEKAGEVALELLLK